MNEVLAGDAVAGGMARVVASALPGRDVLSLGLTSAGVARELLNAKAVWVAALRQDYDGDEESATSLCGEGKVARELYLAASRALGAFRRGYRVVQGDISRPPPIDGKPAEALVVPNHPQLLDVGFGAAHAVHRAAGPALVNHIQGLLEQKPHGFDIGSAVTCPGFATGRRAIIFVISPPQFMSAAARSELLERSYDSAFAAIRHSGAESAALAAIATGLGGASASAAGAACARGALAHMAAGGGPCMAVCFDPNAVDAFEQARQAVLHKPFPPARQMQSERIEVDPNQVLRASVGSNPNGCSVQ